ncbi:MAG: hypothetical protein AB1540_07410 [Bdellovibrionota bacterium]
MTIYFGALIIILIQFAGGRTLLASAELDEDPCNVVKSTAQAFIDSLGDQRPVLPVEYRDLEKKAYALLDEYRTAKANKVSFRSSYRYWTDLAPKRKRESIRAALKNHILSKEDFKELGNALTESDATAREKVRAAKTAAQAARASAKAPPSVPLGVQRARAIIDEHFALEATGKISAPRYNNLRELDTKTNYQTLISQLKSHLDDGEYGLLKQLIGGTRSRIAHENLGVRQARSLLAADNAAAARGEAFIPTKEWIEGMRPGQLKFAFPNSLIKELKKRNWIN